jgi:hypothetical protein
MELHRLEKYDIEFVKSLITNEIEESINIEFKSAEALSKVDSKKKELSKDVSAMANSNGGIIVYGINEVNHKADSISFIDGNEFSKEWIEQVISSTIQRNIPELKIFPIRENGDMNKTIYVVQIPESTEAPHICKDKKFYKRYNFESVAMEEYEVRQLYGRRIKSKLELNGYNISFIKNKDDFSLFTVQVDVINVGEKFESNYKVNVYFEGPVKDINISWRTDGVNRDNNYTILSQNKLKITANASSTIYPNECLNVIRFDFNIKSKDVEEVLKTLNVSFKLYYSNGEDDINTDLSNLYDTIKGLI